MRSEAEEQLSRVIVLYKKIDGSRIDKITCQEKLAEARLALGKVAMAEATSRACLSRMLEIHSVEHQHCLRLFVAWARCMRLLPYPALTFAVLRFVLECKVALGAFDRAFQAAWVELRALSEGFTPEKVHGASRGDEEGEDQIRSSVSEV